MSMLSNYEKKNTRTRLRRLGVEGFRRESTENSELEAKVVPAGVGTLMGEKSENAPQYFQCWYTSWMARDNVIRVAA